MPPEFTLAIFLRRDQATGRTWTVFRFATTREFRSFQYEIKVEERFDAEARTLDFHIRGVGASASPLPSAGAAQKECIQEGLHGEYAVNVMGAKQASLFRIDVERDAIRLLKEPDGEFVTVSIEKGVEPAGR